MTARSSHVFPHHLRFARSLALLTTLALPACSSTSAEEGRTDTKPAAATGEEAPAPVPSASASTPVPAPAPVASAEDAGAVDADASPGKVSGPLPPPELPLELA